MGQIDYLKPPCRFAGEHNAGRWKSPELAPDQVLHIEETSIITTYNSDKKIHVTKLLLLKGIGEKTK